jgi:predicted PurR-regulated permease PerM
MYWILCLGFIIIAIYFVYTHFPSLFRQIDNIDNTQELRIEKYKKILEDIQSSKPLSSDPLPPTSTSSDLDILNADLVEFLAQSFAVKTI